MKRLTAFLFASFFVTGVGHTSLPGLLTQKYRDWNFIQAVGGMEVKLDGKQLEINCNVSGLKAITVKPTLINSGIGVRKVAHSREDDVIRLAVQTSVLEKGMKTDCGSVDLSDHPAGKYRVVYVDPDGKTHPVGDIDLP